MHHGNVSKMSGFQWTKTRSQAAVLLALGYRAEEVALRIGVADRTIYRWKDQVEFMAEVDRLSLMTDVASRAERLRIAKRVVRQKTRNGLVLTEKDILDWLKFAQSETDGVKLDLATLAEAAASLAGGGSD